MTVSSRTTDSPMSTDSSRSRRNGGSGTIISSTTAITAMGASRNEARNGSGLAGVLMTVGLSASQDDLLQAHEVREHLGDGAEQRARNRFADFGTLVEGARQRNVFHARHAMLGRHLSDAGGHQVLSFGHNDRG